MFKRKEKLIDEKQRRAILHQVNTLAWLLDNSIYVPVINYRIGLDALIGLVPGFGDLAGVAMSSYIVVQAVRLGVPRATLVRMVINIAIEATFGLLPIIGNFFDATFKANARNVTLLKNAVNDAYLGRRMHKNAGRGFVTVVLGALVAFVAVVSAATVALYSWIASRLR